MSTTLSWRHPLHREEAVTALAAGVAKFTTDVSEIPSGDDLDGIVVPAHWQPDWPVPTNWSVCADHVQAGGRVERLDKDGWVPETYTAREFRNLGFTPAYIGAKARRLVPIICADTAPPGGEDLVLAATKAIAAVINSALRLPQTSTALAREIIALPELAALPRTPEPTDV